MRVAISIVLVALLSGAYLLMHEQGALTSWDRTQKEWRYSFDSTPPSGEVVLVEIDSDSLRELSVWPWPRRLHADLLNKMMALGATDVAFDIDFSSSSNAEDDLAFADALDRAGGYAYLAAFEQVSGITGELARAEPIAMFAAYAEPILINVDLDRDGSALSFPTQSSGGGARIESLATTLGYPQYVPPSRMLFDFRIDATKIDRISFVDVLLDRVDRERIIDKQVIVGASAIELRDFFDTPRFGVIPGALLQALALETVKSKRILQDWGTWPGLVFAALAFLAILTVGRRWTPTGKAALLGLAAIATELGAFLALQTADIVMSTHVGLLVLPTIFALEIGMDAAAWLKQKTQLQRRLQYLARHDDVTNVLSRVGFIDKLSTCWTPGEPLIIAVIRIDRLNPVRGTLGEEVADLTLHRIARRLEQFSDCPLGVLRQGLFTMAAQHEMDRRQMIDLVEEIHRVIRKPLEIDRHAVLVDARIGLASAEADDTSVVEVINKAMIALSEPSAQAAAKSQAALFAPAYAAQLAEQRKLDIAMRKAIERNELRLAFQPQIEIGTGKLVGLEALVRWRSAEMGDVSPGKFVGLAEETGYIVEIGQWVMEQSCQLTARWKWKGELSVNISPTQFALSDVTEMVDDALTLSGYPPERLIVEVTESILLDEAERTIDTLRRFQSKGIRIAIDDFGTGYSSLSYLSRLPFDKLKIDQAFLRGDAAKPSNRAILDSVVRMGHQMKKTVIAEGVETTEDLAVLKSIKCDQGQGFLFGRPVDAQTLIGLLNKKRAG